MSYTPHQYSISFSQSSTYPKSVITQFNNDYSGSRSPDLMKSKYVRLNIGGVVFEAKKETLEKEPKSIVLL